MRRFILKPCPHQQQCRRNIIKTVASTMVLLYGNNVEAMLNFVEEASDFVERTKFQRKTRSTLLPNLATKSNAASTLLPKMATMSKQRSSNI